MTMRPRLLIHEKQPHYKQLQDACPEFRNVVDVVPLSNELHELGDTHVLPQLRIVVKDDDGNDSTLSLTGLSKVVQWCLAAVQSRQHSAASAPPESRPDASENSPTGEVLNFTIQAGTYTDEPLSRAKLAQQLRECLDGDREQ